MGKKLNKPRWKELETSERLARRAESWGFSDNIVEMLRKLGKRKIMFMNT